MSGVECPESGGSVMATRIAVLGTGIMGAAMARNLLKAGFEVGVWNRTREKAEPLSEEGAMVAASPEEAAEGADFLITMLPTAEVIEEVLGDGVLGALARDGVWLQTSTVGVSGCGKLAELAKRAGVSYVDAPVLGTKQPAERGELVVIASGPEELKERCAPVFDAVGRRTLWLGPEAGEASRLKLVANNWIDGLLGALAETIALARALGVDPEGFLNIIEGGQMDSPYAQMKGRMMIKGEYPVSFPLELARKDVGLILEAAAGGALGMPVSEAVASHFDRAIESGHGQEDMAAIYEGVQSS